jgi:hypothetical protein
VPIGRFGSVVGAVVMSCATVWLAVSGVAEAQTPCGRTNRVGAQGATVYRTASGFTPTGKHIPANTLIRDGRLLGDRVEAIGSGGWIATTTLETYPGATCY